MRQDPDISLEFHEHMTRVVDPTAAMLGLSERWVAPLAIIDAPTGFGEDAWIDAIPASVVAARISGAPIVCEWGRSAGSQSRGTGTTLHPAGTPNHYRADGKCLFAHIYLPNLLVDRVADGLKPGAQASGQLRDDLVFMDDAELNARTRAYLSAARNGPESSGLEMEARAILLVARLLSHHGFGALVTGAKGGLAPWQVSRIDAFLREAPEQAISLDTLAGQVGLSPFHFARAFKASMGMPPHRYLVQLRIAKARELLETTGLPVIEIAARIGYEDPSYLARLFRREVGVTPAAYRRERRR